MKKKVNRRFQLSNEENKELDRIFNIAGEKSRLSYVYAVCLIQSAIFIFFKRSTPIEKINKWFYKVYFIKEYESGKINFYYIDIVTKYLKEKYNVDFDKIKDILLAKLNYAQKLAKEDTFETLEDYLEYMVNKGLDEKSLDRVYNWIVK